MKPSPNLSEMFIIVYEKNSCALLTKTIVAELIVLYRQKKVSMEVKCNKKSQSFWEVLTTCFTSLEKQGSSANTVRAHILT